MNRRADTRTTRLESPAQDDRDATRAETRAARRPVSPHLIRRAQLFGDDARIRRSIDTRQVKTRTDLLSAAFAVVAEVGVDATTIAEVARRAGRNRSTFYAHAPTVLALLESALAEELLDGCDEQIARIDARDPGAVTQALIVGMLEHLESREALYQWAFREETASRGLQQALHDAFAINIVQLLNAGPLILPGTAGDQTDAHRTAVEYITAGVVASMLEWLRVPAPRSHTAFLELLRLLLPGWWPLHAPVGDDRV